MGVGFNASCCQMTFINVDSHCLSRETNLKFKMGLKVTDERLQEENQLAQFNGE